MKKILILANSSGGLYDFRNELVERLLSENEVVASVPDEVRTKELEEEGCRVMCTPINRRGMNPLEDFKLFVSYLKLLKMEKPDMVLTYTIKPNVYGGMACRIRKIPYIATITGLGSTFQKRGLVRTFVTVLYRIGLKKASCIFFQNQENYEIFINANIKGKSSKIVKGSGVNLQRHTFEQYPMADETIFLYVGRMMREKGIEELLEAAKSLQSEKVKFQLLGYCDDYLKEKLDKAEADGYICQLGFSPDVHEYIKHASALVLPTYHEGMSNVLMEASATGRPVIATRISGCREIFEEGITGFGCETQNSSDLIRALKEFLALSISERSNMGKRAREKMEREFDRQMIVNDYYEEIQKILL